MGTNKDRNERIREINSTRETEDFGSFEKEGLSFFEVVDFYKKRLIGIGLSYQEIEKMTLIDMKLTYEERNKRKAYEIWRLASFTHDAMISNFPDTPEIAMPELYPIANSIKKPKWMK